jgi:hypothetical protein
MQAKKVIKDSILSLLVITITAGTYAAITADLPNVNTWESLTADSWNNVVDTVDDHTTKLSWITNTSWNLDVTWTVTADGLTVENNSTDVSSTIKNTLMGGWRTASLNLYPQNDENYGINITAWGNSWVGTFKYNQKNIMQFDMYNDVSFYEDTGTTSKMKWDASEESLVVWAPTTSYKFEVQSNTSWWTEPQIVSRDVGSWDASIGFQIKSTNNWSAGVDNSDSGKFKISTWLDVGSSPKLSIDTSGNVWIWTNNPRVPLDVKWNWATLGGQIAHAVISDSRTMANWVWWRLTFEGNYNNNINASFASVAWIKENWTNWEYWGALTFYTRKHWSNQTESMRISSTGNVWIWTKNPNTAFHVQKPRSTNNDWVALIQQQNATNTPTLVVRQDTWWGNSYDRQWLLIDVAWTNPWTGKSLSVVTNNPNLFWWVWTEVFTVLNWGNVWIWNDQPNANLTISTSSLNPNANWYNAQNAWISIQYKWWDNINEEGNGIFFTQRFATENVDASQIRTWGIVGYKASGSWHFGWGLRFKVQQQWANPMLTAMAIDNTGNVWIWVTNPDAKLVVAWKIVAWWSNIAVTNWWSAYGQSMYSPAPNELAFSSNSVERMRILSNGAIKIWQFSTVWASSGKQFDAITGYYAIQSSIPTTNNDNHLIFYTPNWKVGSITTSGSSTLYNTTSDYRLKENVTPMSSAVERLNALKPVRFNYKADKDVTVDWFLAHEVQEVVPEAVSWVKDGVDEEGNPDYQAMDYAKVTPLLTAALQEALKEIEKLKESNKTQLIENEKFRKEIELLKK